MTAAKWMTKFRSRSLGALLILLVTAGCAGRSGNPLEGPLPPEVARAYIPLMRPVMLLGEFDAGAVMLGNGLAVTAAHADRLLDPKTVIGTSPDYDLTFFHVAQIEPILTPGEPQMGQRVIAYAHYDQDLYHAEGVITALDAPVEARCDTCAVQSAFTFDGNAGPGYSGGPVLDAQSGKLLGIVFGYVDRPGGGRTIYAYPMQRVWDELKKIQEKRPG